VDVQSGVGATFGCESRTLVTHGGICPTMTEDVTHNANRGRQKGLGFGRGGDYGQGNAANWVDVRLEDVGTEGLRENPLLKILRQSGQNVNMLPAEEDLKVQEGRGIIEVDEVLS
jgi:hypothetical protein